MKVGVPVGAWGRADMASKFVMNTTQEQIISAISRPALSLSFKSDCRLDWLGVGAVKSFVSVVV